MVIDRRPLSVKIDESIDLIRQYSELACSKWDGYVVAFSGGKDSQVVLLLVKMAGVPFRAVHNITTIDYPENIYFIRKCYPMVQFNFTRQNFFSLMERFKDLPTIGKRWCCNRLKERVGNGFFIDGVRAEESAKRATYDVINFKGGRVFDVSLLRRNRKVMLHPILHWNEADVWQFIEDNNIPVNPLYDSKNRVGCMFCPFASAKQRLQIRTDYPRYYSLMIRSIERIMAKGFGAEYQWESAHEVYDWWCSGKSMETYMESKRQLKLNL